METKFIAAALLLCAAPLSARADDFDGALRSIDAQALSVSADSLEPQERLLQLTSDPDPSIRLEALQGLRNDMGLPGVKERVLAILANKDERTDVREQAARDLTAFTNDWDADEALLQAAKDADDPLELRAFAMHALYNGAVFDSNVRSYLTNESTGWMEDTMDLRLAATWGLFAASQADPNVREALLNNLGKDRDPRLRLESLKSLYRGMNDSDVREKMIAIASDVNEDPALRCGAALALSASVNDSDARDTLTALTAQDQPDALRRAAILSLGNAYAPEIQAYFHVGYQEWPSGTFIDPLDQP